MLTGIPAFEARWLSLRLRYPTSLEENLLIAQAMGQLVDNYASPHIIEARLPRHLRSLFEELAIAYFHGYTPAPESAPAAQSGHQSSALPHPQQNISAAVEQVRQLARQIGQRRRHDPRFASDLNEADTLVVEFTDNWPESRHPKS